MKTVSAKSSEVKRDWLLVDASDATLGRLASKIAHRLSVSIRQFIRLM